MNPSIIKCLEPILYLVMLLLSLIVQMLYFLKDDRTQNNTPQDLKIKWVWHAAAGVLHIWCGVMMGRCFGWQWMPITSSIMWLLFDGAINTWVLKREWFYIGTTAQIDRAQRSVAGWIHIDPRLLSAVLKISFLIGSIVFLIIY